MRLVAKLKFLYCGRGDTILVESRTSEGHSSHWGLVDCYLTKKASGAYWRLRDVITGYDIRELKFVCLTHPDRDHYFGMRDLLEERFYDEGHRRLRIDEFWDSGIDFRLLGAIAHRLGMNDIKQEIDALYRFFLPVCLGDGVEHRAMNQGCLSTIEFGDFFFLCLSPRKNRVDRFNHQTLRSILGGNYNEVLRRKEMSNDLSVVLAFVHKTLPLNVILTGDASARIWQQALPVWVRLAGLLMRKNLRFSAVKVSHHGAGSNKIKYLYPTLYSDYCIPETTVAILSVGPCDQKHPDPTVLRVLEQNGIRAYATCWPAESFEPVREEFPLPGSPLTTRDNGLPSLPNGHDWADIEITMQDNGSLVVSPEKCRLI